MHMFAGAAKLSGARHGNTRVLVRSVPDMPTEHSRHIPLTGPPADNVEAQVAKGEYLSASDVTRAAIRLPTAQDGAKVGPRLGNPTAARRLHEPAGTDG